MFSPRPIEPKQKYFNDGPRFLNCPRKNMLREEEKKLKKSNKFVDCSDYVSALRLSVNSFAPPLLNNYTVGSSTLQNFSHRSAVLHSRKFKFSQQASDIKTRMKSKQTKILCVKSFARNYVTN